jgi:hypothetical protein
MGELAKGGKMLAKLSLSHLGLQPFLLRIQPHHPVDNPYVKERQTANGDSDQDQDELTFG